MRRFRRPAVTVSKRRVILFRLFLVFCAAFAVFSVLDINQTQHRIFIRFTVEMSAILPGYSTSVTVENEVCIAQTLIVGKVPQFYASGS